MEDISAVVVYLPRVRGIQIKSIAPGRHVKKRARPNGSVKSWQPMNSTGKTRMIARKDGQRRIRIIGKITGRKIPFTPRKTGKSKERGIGPNGAETVVHPF